MPLAVGSSTVRVHHPGLVRFFERRTGSRELAEDFAQETWIATGHFRGSCSLRAYLYSVASKLVMSWYRQKYARKQVNLGSDSYILGKLGAALTSVEGKLQEAMGLQELHAAVESLDEPFRETLRLWLQGHEVGEISVLLEIPANTVRSRLHRARVRLMAKLSRSRRRRGPT